WTWNAPDPTVIAIPKWNDHSPHSGYLMMAIAIRLMRRVEGGMRILTMALLLSAMATSATAKTLVSQEVWLCAIGQFASDDGTSIVEIDNGAIGVGACPMTPAKVKGSKKRTVMSARWAGCDGFKGPVRVAARL